MNYRGHITLGVILSIPLIWISVLLGLSLSLHISVFFIVVIYNVLPDIDIGTSKIFKIFSTVIVFLIGYFVYHSNIIVSSMLYVFFLVYMWANHRGMFHTYYVGVLLSVPLYYFHWFLLLCGFLGYSLHIISDKSKLKKILFLLRMDVYFYGQSWKSRKAILYNRII